MLIFSINELSTITIDLEMQKTVTGIFEVFSFWNPSNRSKMKALCILAVGQTKSNINTRYTRYIAFGLWLCVIWTVKNQKENMMIALILMSFIPAGSRSHWTWVLRHQHHQRRCCCDGPRRKRQRPHGRTAGVRELVAWWSLMWGSQDIVGGENWRGIFSLKFERLSNQI